MNDDLSCYLHDHLAGATFAIELLQGLRDQKLELEVAHIADILLREITEDCETLKELANQVGSPPSGLKDAVAWMAQKASRIKLNLNTTLGIFEAVETIAIGIQGKLALWNALRVVGDKPAPLKALDLEPLISRAINQHSVLEESRLELAASVFGIAPFGTIE